MMSGVSGCPCAASSAPEKYKDTSKLRRGVRLRSYIELFELSEELVVTVLRDALEYVPAAVQAETTDIRQSSARATKFRFAEEDEEAEVDL
jgi:hypothetical protein